MLVNIPLGLLPAAVAFDIVYLTSGDAGWSRLPFWLIAGGIAGGLAAAVFGTIDYLSIPAGTRAKRIGWLHAMGNVLVVALFTASWILRYRHAEVPSPLAIALAMGGVGLAIATGWLGGELAAGLGVGGDDGGHLATRTSPERPRSHDAPRRQVHLARF